MLILASSSQTRAKILKDNGIKFEQIGCDFDEESLTCKEPKSFVYQATMGKMQRFTALHGLTKPTLCADTVVACEGKILRKAKDENSAREILNLQSGNKVAIITCMVYKNSKITLFDLSSTTYQFAKFDDKSLDIYLSSNEWKGKAGACMVEGFCKDYILSVHGYQSTAMGLCIEKLIPFLKVSD